MAESLTFKLLVVSDAASVRSRFIFGRTGDDDAYPIKIFNGYAELQEQFADLLKQGITFRNCVFASHGHDGRIRLGSTRIFWNTWYEQFANRGYDRLFPFKGTKLYFEGCSIGEGPQGWAFLDAAARTLLRSSGGTALAWTSSGYSLPPHWHSIHFSGDVRQVVFDPDGDGGANLRYYAGGKRVDDGKPPYDIKTLEPDQ